MIMGIKMAASANSGALERALRRWLCKVGQWMA